MSRPITRATIAAAAYHDANEGGDANEEQDVMEGMRDNK